MTLPGPEHVIFIPGMIMIGMVIGWILGSRAAKEQLAQKKRRARE